MLKNLVKFSNYLSNLWTNMSVIKRIVYHPQIFSIRPLFVSFHLVLHQIVRAWPNIIVTYLQMANGKWAISLGHCRSYFMDEITTPFMHIDTFFTIHSKKVYCGITITAEHQKALLTWSRSKYFLLISRHKKVFFATELRKEWKLPFSFLRCDEESLLNGKAHYSWPPSTNYLGSAVFIVKFYYLPFLIKKIYLNKDLNGTKLSPLVSFPWLRRRERAALKHSRWHFQSWFYNQVILGQCYTTFYGCQLQIFIKR